MGRRPGGQTEGRNPQGPAKKEIEEVKAVPTVGFSDWVPKGRGHCRLSALMLIQYPMSILCESKTSVPSAAAWRDQVGLVSCSLFVSLYAIPITATVAGFWEGVRWFCLLYIVPSCLPAVALNVQRRLAIFVRSAVTDCLLPTTFHFSTTRPFSLCGEKGSQRGPSLQIGRAHV